ncbi:Six-hairpin glycosidase [Basidiobolus meristosporus CBS 931.73]|uniref:Six-hairpin glycosidase n=1 Tax=Basidiobolus meristosporus CBS 931.73 TaxID=1314790 RepID=A0A1Y1Z923_9FUNG|nr:Six-hairpin glycosidase [Basidiobolus meristosporus CBS 931.73]|eukprot:ORY06305.1 Six-hairpin glycosidase [Basidiobolus meristosporus CBS 931.73]
MNPAIEQKYVAWRNRYLRSANGNSYYVYYNDKDEIEKVGKLKPVTCSEAHGYGMLIAVLKDNRQDFDCLVNYFESFKNRKGLMAWQQVMDLHTGRLTNSPDGGENCATDGDLDIAAALFIAAKTWNEPSYRDKAISLCQAIYKHCVNWKTCMFLLGDWVEHGSKYEKLTRPSDFLLTHLLLFSREDAPERRDGWTRVLEATIRTIEHQLTLHPHTGLIADFLEFNGHEYVPVKGEVLESKHDKDYSWNSCRVPWRLSIYYLESRDIRVYPILQAQANFFAHQSEVKAGYKLNGKELEDYSDLAFMAPAALSMWLINHPKLGEVQDQMDELDDNTYFGETIALLCLLQVTRPHFNV